VLFVLVFDVERSSVAAECGKVSEQQQLEKKTSERAHPSQIHSEPFAIQEEHGSDLSHLSFFFLQGAQLAGERFLAGRGTVVVRGLAFFFLPPREAARERGEGVGFDGTISEVEESSRL
jgi:hypothetical protein